MEILEAVAMEIPCSACGGRYEVTLQQILLSQKMLHEGCPVQADSECPPLAYSGLADPQTIRELREVWDRLEEQARKAGGQMKLRGG